MIEIFNRAWLGMEEMTSLSGDAHFFWGITGFCWGKDL
jgi:hypothetical protein